jgi:putative transposase
MVNLTQKIDFGYKLMYREDYEDYLEFNAKRLMKQIIQESIYKEFEHNIGAHHYERSTSRSDYRNGYYHRNLKIENYFIDNLCIPMARGKKIDYTAFEKWQKLSNKFKEKIMDYILAGNSFKNIVKLVSEEFFSISKQTISNILQEFKKEQIAFNNSPITDDIVLLYVDGIYKKVKAHNTVILAALGINKKGEKKILGFESGLKGESESLCYRFLNKLKHRGLEGNNLKLIVRDGSKGIKNAAYDVYPFSKQQNCLVHAKRNILKRVSRANLKKFSKELKKLFNAKNISDYYKRFGKLKKKYTGIEDKAIKHIKQIEEETLTYLNFNDDMRRILSTNNYIERFMGMVNTFMNRRKSFTTIGSLELFFYLEVYNYNNEGFCLNKKGKQVLKNFTQFS